MITHRDRASNPLPSPRLTAIALVLSLASGIGLGIAARGPNVLGWDVDVTTAVQDLHGSAFKWLANAGNTLGSTQWASIIIVVVLIIAAITREWLDLAFLASLLVLRMVGTQIKPIFDSPRPTDDLVNILGVWHGTGYPSGHALTASTMALGLAVIAWRRIPSRTLAAGVMAVLIALALLVGWARIWTGAHWTSDVIGGYAFGVANVAASLLVLHLFSLKARRGQLKPNSVPAYDS
jgi:undecaprenyl-diphosphatase